MLGIYRVSRSFLMFAGTSFAGLTGFAQNIVVLTGPANQPYNLLVSDSPVADSFTIGTQINGQQVSGVPLLMVTEAAWISLNSDCTVPGASSISVPSTATVSFCVDPSKAPGNGYYVGLVQITAPLDSRYPIFDLPVKLTRFPTGDLSPDPATVTMDSNQTSAAVAISEDPNGQSAKGSPITVSAQLGLPNPAPEGNWLQYNLKNGSVSVGSPGEIDVQVVPGNLVSQAPADYVHTIVLTDSFGDTKPLTVKFTVLQQAAPPVRSFAHIAPQPPFATQIVLTNSSGQSLNFTLKFLHDDGSEFAVPVTTPAGTQNQSSISDSIVPYGTKYYDLSGASSNPNNLWGSAQLIATSAITGVAIFRNVPSSAIYYEAAVPLATGSTSFVAAFDLSTSPVTNQSFVTGLAIANLDASKQAVVNCTARDGNGNPIPNGSFKYQLAPNGHTAAVLGGALGGTRGSLSCTSNTSVSAVVLRFLGYEFTTLPVAPTS